MANEQGHGNRECGVYGSVWYARPWDVRLLSASERYRGSTRQFYIFSVLVGLPSVSLVTSNFLSASTGARVVFAVNLIRWRYSGHSIVQRGEADQLCGANVKRVRNIYTHWEL